MGLRLSMPAWAEPSRNPSHPADQMTRKALMCAFPSCNGTLFVNLFPFLFVVEHGLFGDLGLQCSQCSFHDLSSQLLFFFRRDIRIAERIWNRNSRNDPVCPNCQGDGNYSTNMHHRNTSPFNFFYHRCAATSAGASRGGEDHSIHPICQQILGQCGGKGFGIGDGSSVSGGGVEITVEFPDFPLFLQISQHIDWNDPV